MIITNESKVGVLYIFDWIKGGMFSENSFRLKPYLCPTYARAANSKWADALLRSLQTSRQRPENLQNQKAIRTLCCHKSNLIFFYILQFYKIHQNGYPYDGQKGNLGNEGPYRFFSPSNQQMDWNQRKGMSKN
jgi:hypothetical protein